MLRKCTCAQVSPLQLETLSEWFGKVYEAKGYCNLMEQCRQCMIEYRIIPIRVFCGSFSLKAKLAQISQVVVSPPLDIDRREAPVHLEASVVFRVF